MKASISFTVANRATLGSTALMPSVIHSIYPPESTNCSSKTLIKYSQL